VGNDAVGALLWRQVMGEADQAVGVLGAARGIDGDADTLRVDVKDRAVEGPALALHPAQERAHE
jgi:hypothetical protein